MVLVNKLGGLLKKATSSKPSLYQAIRCMSSNASSELKRRTEEEEIRKRAISLFVYKSSLYRNSTYCSRSPFSRKIRIKRIKRPTHYLEVNYRTLKVVVYYGPNIGHIPHVSAAIRAMDGKDDPDAAIID